MKLGAAPIPPGLTDGLSKVSSPTPAGEQDEFQRALLQAAPNQSHAAPPVTDRTLALGPPSEVQRTTTQTGPLGESVLQKLSSLYRGNAVAPVAVSDGATLPKVVHPGPAEQPLLLQPGTTGTSIPGGPQGVDGFSTMVTHLKGIYNNAIEVSLVSKSTNSAGSSLNKLLSAG
ncbi:nodulation protein NolB [Bradyrhizobium sp. UFLA05-153]